MILYHTYIHILLLELAKLNRGVKKSKCFLFNFPFLSQLDRNSKRRRIIKLKEVMDIGHGKNYIEDNRAAHKCNQCEYTSSRADTLRIHLKIHSGEKTNKCNQCDYACSDPSYLKEEKHLKTHSGERPNKCNQCNYASIRADQLMKHMGKHA